MDMQSAGNLAQIVQAVAAVVVPSCGLVIIAVKYMILTNNDVMLEKINGKYVKKEVLEEWRAGLEKRLSDGSQRFASMEDAIRSLER